MITAVQQKLKSLSVFFPVYNEEANLPLLLAQAHQVFPRFAKRLEMIIINDGSTDHSLAVAQRLKAQYPQLKIISHRKNLGYGECLKTGIKASQLDWIFWTDADLQFNLEDFAAFAQAASKHVAVIGYRIKRAEGLKRRIMVRVFKFAIDLLFRLHVKDIDCAFKLIRADLLKDLHLQSGSAFTTSEILYRLKKKRVKFKELPVQHFPRQYGQPTGAKLSVLIKAALDALNTYLNIKFNRDFR